MPEPYTPFTEEVREQYWAASGEPSRNSESKQAFDRWIVAHDVQVKAEAWDESCKALAWCMDNGGDNLQDIIAYVTANNPYLAAELRADSTLPTIPPLLADYCCNAPYYVGGTALARCSYHSHPEGTKHSWN